MIIGHGGVGRWWYGVGGGGGGGGGDGCPVVMGDR